MVVPPEAKSDTDAKLLTVPPSAGLIPSEMFWPVSPPTHDAKSTVPLVS